MTSSKVFLYFCLSFILGILLNSLFSITQLMMLGFLFLGTLLIFLSLYTENKKLTVLGFCLVLVLVGAWRYQIAELKIVNNELQNYNDQDQTITLVGMVSGEPDIRENSTKLEIEIESFGRDKVLITTNRYPEYNYGDKLKIKGELKTPQVFEDFNYKDYLAKEGIYSVIYWPETEKVADGQGNPIFVKILSFKEKLRESIYQNLSPPQSSILGSMILGDRRRMSEGLKEKLNIAGVRHITAISGMHIPVP